MDKQIIIDGVDVSGCEFLNDRYCKIAINITGDNARCDVKRNCYYKQLQSAKEEIENFKRKIKRLDEETAFTEESCPHCDNIVELPPYKGIYECPECGKLIVCCSTCDWDNISCNSCKYTLLLKGYDKLTEELTTLKQDYESCEKEYRRVVKENKELKIKLFT